MRPNLCDFRQLVHTASRKQDYTVQEPIFKNGTKKQITLQKKYIFKKQVLRCSIQETDCTRLKKQGCRSLAKQIYSAQEENNLAKKIARQTSHSAKKLDGQKNQLPKSEISLKKKESLDGIRSKFYTA